jgi:hypothetical protein
LLYERYLLRKSVINKSIIKFELITIAFRTAGLKKRNTLIFDWESLVRAVRKLSATVG